MGNTIGFTASTAAAATTPWVSGSTTIATVTNTGTVKGVAYGTSLITYTDVNGCQNDTTVTVDSLPVVTGTSTIIKGGTSQLASLLAPSATTPWVSSNTAIATVTNTGLVTAVAGGSCTITYTDIDGCTTTFTITVSVNPVVSGTLAICSTGTTQLSATGVAATTNPWVSSNTSAATVNTTGLVTGVAGGTTTITYTDNNGNKGTATVTVTTAPNAGTLAGTTAICSNGATTFTSNGDAGAWTSGTVGVATINSATGLIAPVSAGNSIMTYTVTGTGGCNNATATRTVTVTTAPNAGTLSGTTGICSNGSTTFASNGDAGAWTSGTVGVATINSASGLIAPVSAGNSIMTYTVTGTGGCNNATATRTVTVTTAPNAGTLSGTTAICSNGATTFTSNGDAGAWTSGTVGIATINSATGLIAPVSAGNSIMTYTVTGTGGCNNATATRTVTITTAPSAGTLSGTQTVCAGSTVLFSSTQAGGAWTTSDATIATIGNTTGSITGVATGTATMTYTVTGTGGCTDATATRTVTVTAGPNPGTLSGGQAICSGGGSTTFSSTQAGGAWTSSDATIATIGNTTGIVSGVAGGTATMTYTVTGTGGCMDVTATRTVTVTTAASAGTLSGTQAVCMAGTSTFSSTQAGGTWSTSDATIATINNITGVITTVAAGTATMTYTVAGTGGCTDATATRTVTITAAPLPGTLSGGQAICSNGGSTIFSSTQAGGTWSTSDATIATIGSTTGTISGVAGGTATMTYTVAGTGGCMNVSATRTVTVTTAAVSGTLSGNQGICKGATTTFVSTQAGGAWSTSDATIATIGNVSGLVSGIAGGTATMTYTVAGMGSCTDATATRTVTVTPIPLAPTGTDVSRCGAGTVTLSATATTAGDALNWYSNASLTSSVGSGTSYTTASISTTTPYYVTESSAGCASTAAIVTATINQIPNPPVTHDVNYCQNATAVALSATGANLMWYSPDGSSSSTAPVPSTVSGGSTTYYVTASSGTCESSKSALVVNVDSITAYAGGPVIRVNEGVPFTIHGNAAATGNNTVSITWSPSMYLSNAHIQNPVITTSMDGVYTMNVSTSDGCAASDNLQVMILKKVVIPNAFSPNGDGINDTWIIQYLEEYLSATVTIFNRYGQIVFQSPAGAYPNKPWDGTYKGTVVPVGTYYYIIKLSDNSQPLSGSISVIK